MSPKMNVRVVPSSKLYVSEPDPSWFGNGANMNNDPHWTNGNWLKSRFHFSFAEYHNGANQNFGALRVMNDDLVQPDRGFGTHPHRNMEIITYIVEGKLTHQDSMGTKESLGRGSIQFMTAGTGVRHSEYNHERDRPLRFIQTWIVPRKNNLAPNYGSSCPDGRQRNTVRHLVSDADGVGDKAPTLIQQDVNAYAAELDLGSSVTLSVPAGRQAYVLCIEGGVAVNGSKMSRHDGCEVMGGGDGRLTIDAIDVEKVEGGAEVAHVLVFEMKAVPESGRGDL